MVVVALLVWPAAVASARSVERVPPAAGRTRRAAVAGLGVAGALVVLWPTAIVVASAAGCVSAVAVWLSAGSPSALEVRRAQSELAIVCELWAAGLECGLAVGTALSAAMDATGSSTDTAAESSAGRLVRVAGLLQLGADSARTWIPAEADPLLAPIAAGARRSAAVGADLAATIRGQARLIGRLEAGAAQRRAGRAGVLMAAPLTLCFLPAFICLGLAPVVIALIGTLDIGR